VNCDRIPDADYGHDLEESLYWWTKRVRFAAGATRTIRDHYVAAPGTYVGGSEEFDSILETGASWSGTIGKADITITLEGISPAWIQIADPPPRITGKRLHWSFRDFEPGSADGSPATITFDWWSPEARARWEKRNGRDSVPE